MPVQLEMQLLKVLRVQAFGHSHLAFCIFFMIPNFSVENPRLLCSFVCWRLRSYESWNSFGLWRTVCFVRNLVRNLGLN